jgi:hypothetical protein
MGMSAAAAARMAAKVGSADRVLSMAESGSGRAPEGKRARAWRKCQGVYDEEQWDRRLRREAEAEYGRRLMRGVLAPLPADERDRWVDRYAAGDIE